MSAKKVAESLSGVLADAYVLLVKTQNYHWHVEGRHFHSLHEMFEAQYNDLFAAVDAIAERIRALGHTAPATMAEFLRLTVLSEGKAGDEHAMVNDLLTSHAAAATRLKRAIKVADDDDDDVSEDMLTGRLAVHQKTAWMLRATLAGMGPTPAARPSVDQAQPTPEPELKAKPKAEPEPVTTAVAVEAAAPAKAEQVEQVEKVEKAAKAAKPVPKAVKPAKVSKVKKARG